MDFDDVRKFMESLFYFLPSSFSRISNIIINIIKLSNEKSKKVEKRQKEIEKKEEKTS